MKRLISLLLTLVFVSALLPINALSVQLSDDVTLTPYQVTLHGFSLFYQDPKFMGGPYGFVSFSSGDPVGASFDAGFRANGLHAGEFYDGSVYAYQRDGDGTYSFYAIDAYTYEETFIAEGLTGAADMAYDYSTDTMFAVLYDELLTVDLTTGQTETVGETGVDGGMLALACSGEGILYGMGADAALYTIDPETGAAYKVGDTGLSADNIQSMAYDHATNTLFWARCETTPFLLSYCTLASDLCIVDTETGEATVIGNIYGSEMQLSCLYSVPPMYEPETEYIPESIELNLTEAYMLVDQTAQLSAEIEPVHAPKGLLWESDNTDVVTVGEGGLLTAVSEGTAHVTATTVYGELTAECEVSVVPEDYLDGLTLDDALAGDGYDGVCSATNDANYPYELDILDGRIAVKSNMHDSSHYALLAVDAGYLTAGSTFKFDWKIDAAYFVHGFILYANVPYTANMTGRTGWLTYEYVVPESGNYVFTWSFWKDTSPTDESTLDCGWIDNVRVESLEEAEISGVTVSPEALELHVGAQKQLTATVEPINAFSHEVTWSSSDETIATVDENGMLTAVSEGEATITVTTADPDIKADCTVTVITVDELNSRISAALNTDGGTLSFENDLEHPWVVDSVSFEGRTAVRSDIAGLDNTSSAVTYNAGERAEGSVLSFEWNASCEGNDYDEARFLVNGETVYTIGGRDLDWTKCEYTIPEDAEYVFTWEYVKDSSQAAGQDCAWIDNIYWSVENEPEPTPEPEYDLGDVNADGDVNAADATLILRHIVGIENEVFHSEYADVNENGIIDTGDATLVLRISVS